VVYKVRPTTEERSRPWPLPTSSPPRGAGRAEPEPRLDLAAQGGPVTDEAAGVDGDDAGGDAGDRQAEGEHDGGADDD
jgi:hypothetical protein